MPTWLGHRVPRYFVKHYPGSFCFWMILTFRSVDWVKKTDLHDVSRTYPIRWKLEHKKNADPSLSKRELFLTYRFWTGTLALFCLWTRTKTLALLEFQVCQPSAWTYIVGSPGSQASGLRLELYYQLSWVSSLPTHPADLDTHQPPQGCETIPYQPPQPSLSISIYNYIGIDVDIHTDIDINIDISYDFSGESQHNVLQTEEK